MQTNFSLTDLNDSELKHADDILRKCVHCGFCTATCPTYVLLGDELDSPRGRIYLIKEMLRQRKPPTNKVVKHIDRCLSCLACVTTCPSGVNYMHLVDRAREYIEKTYTRPFWDACLRSLLSRVLPDRHLFSLAVKLAHLCRPIRFLLPTKISRLWKLIPNTKKTVHKKTTSPDTINPTSPDRTVALLSGCVQLVLESNINQATTRILSRHKCNVKTVDGSGCCGALSHHLGKTESAKRYAQINIKLWHEELIAGNIESIVVNASGCGTMVKDYGHIFRNDPDWADRAALVSQNCLDISELLSDMSISGLNPEPIKVTYHSACSLQHGQKIESGPKSLLRNCGYDVVDIPESHLCCGSAGTYNILQPKLADQLLARKLANIDKTKSDVIAAGNIGCILQLRQGSSRPVVHTVELLDWATGGPKPHSMLD